jgi:hypothetical protein
MCGSSDPQEGQGVYSWLGWGRLPEATSEWIDKAVAAGPNRADSDVVIGSDRRRARARRRLLDERQQHDSDAQHGGSFGVGTSFDPMAFALGSSPAYMPGGARRSSGGSGGGKKMKGGRVPYVDVRVAVAKTKLYELER